MIKVRVFSKHDRNELSARWTTWRTTSTLLVVSLLQIGSYLHLYKQFPETLLLVVRILTYFWYVYQWIIKKIGWASEGVPYGMNIYMLQTYTYCTVLLQVSQ